MKKIIRNIAKISLPFLLGISILVWVYKDFDFSQVKEVLFYRMNYSWMLLSLVFGIFSHVFRGWRWKLTLEPLGFHPRTSNCVNAIFISYATNLVIPRLGEISRCGVLSKYDGVSFSQSLGTVVIERLIDTVCVLLIVTLAFFLRVGDFTRFFINTGTNIDSISEIFTSPHFYIILFSTIGVLVLLYIIVRSLSYYEKIKGVMANIWKGILSLKKVTNKPLFILYTFLIWLCYYLQLYVTFYCFDFTSHLDPIAALTMFAVGSIAVVVPTPNGAGPWHFAVISMMTLYGISNVQAGVFALIVHGIHTFLIILLGIYGLFALSFTNKK